MGMTLFAVFFVVALFGFIAIGTRQFSTSDVRNPLAAFEAEDLAGNLPKRLGDVDAIEIGPLLQWGEFCGGAIFRMSSETAKEIAGSGLTFFEGLSKGRNSNDGKVEKWSEWKQTPIAEAERQNGTYTPEVQCMKLSRGLNETIYSALTKGSTYVAAREGGAYQGAIIVIPGERLIVLSYYD